MNFIFNFCVIIDQIFLEFRRATLSVCKSEWICRKYVSVHKFMIGVSCGAN